MPNKSAAQPSLFRNALDRLGERRVMQFESFSEYKRRNGYPDRDTAQAISIQTLADLSHDLRSEQVMVFRCGGSESKRTKFALARADAWPADFFILDEDFDREPEIFLSRAPIRELFTFKLIKPVERTLLNLSLTTGALANLLELEDPTFGHPGATGNSPYSFEFQPHSEDDTVLSHDAGQVEIDLLFAARRWGKDVVFVIEAKQDKSSYKPDHLRSNLAKHKLLFPTLAIRPRVPRGMEIVPIYLKAVVTDHGVDFHVAECKPYFGGDDAIACLDKMIVSRRKSVRVSIHYTDAN